MLNFKKYFVYSILEEATKPLTYTEFSKKATPKRGDRKKIFLQKYKEGQPFRVRKDGVEQEIIFAVKSDVIEKVENLLVGNPNTKSSSYKEAEAIYNSIELSDVTSPGDKYSMKDILKAGEFAGKGSGGGSDKTRLNESSVCVWAAVYQATKAASYSIVRKTAEKDEVKNYYDIDETTENIINQKDQTWVDHYERVAEFMHDEVLGSEKYVFHRGSSFVQKIYNKYKALNKLQDTPFGDSNKWNPADIWAQSTNITVSDILSMIDTATDIMRLNNILIDLYNQKKLIGISLKQTGKNVHSTEYNLEKHSVKATVTSLDPGSGSKGIFAKDCYILGSYTYDTDSDTEFEMQFRSFSPWTDFQGEIKGDLAAGGRIGYGILNNILKRYNLPVLPKIDEVSAIAADPTTNVDMLRDIFEDYISLGGTLTKSKDVEDFIYKVNTPGASPASEDFVYCKYMALKWLKTINSVNSVTRNKIIGDILRYALSASEASGPFVKIY